MGYVYDEKRDCISIRNKEGVVAYVCVATEEDLGKKKIFIFDEEGNQKSFEKTSDITKFLRKSKFPSTEIIKTISFINRRLRLLRERKIKGGITSPHIGFGFEEETKS
jgi:hypothetical protein